MIGYPTCMLHIAPDFILILYNLKIFVVFSECFHLHACGMQTCLLIVFTKYNQGKYAMKISIYN